MWLARDLGGGLYFYEDKPNRNEEEGFFDSGTDPFSCAKIYDNSHPEVTWENSPVEVELKLKGVI